MERKLTPSELADWKANTNRVYDELEILNPGPRPVEVGVTLIPDTPSPIMGAEHIIRGKVDDHHHDGKRANMRRDQASQDMLDEWRLGDERRQRIAAHELGESPTEVVLIDNT